MYAGVFRRSGRPTFAWVVSPAYTLLSKSTSFPEIDMAFYTSDLDPLKLRTIQGLDQGKIVTFQEIRQTVAEGTLLKLLDRIGDSPIPAIPPRDFQEILEALGSVLTSTIDREEERFYITTNGFCLFLAALLEVDRLHSRGARRPEAH